MFKFVKANTVADVDLVFQFCNSINSFIQFNYKFDDQPLKSQNSKVVSGLDSNKPINCTFKLITDRSETVVSQENSEKLRNTYVISLFRLPVLATDVVNQSFSSTIIKVMTRQQIEFWYVLGVRKTYEYVSGKKYMKIKFKGDEYNKELFRVSGYIPNDLLRALNKHRVKNVNYLHSICVSAPPSVVDNSKITVVTTE